ncbi:MAG: mucoidy inhibitor MuiA family protein [Nitrospirae bacterium]|nr:mucoidy inhibitor MuiA family protein [Nitrospirota bacterium]
MSRLRIAVPLLFFAFVLPAAAATLEVTPSSRIDAVTVYLNSARVTRIAKIDLPAGEIRVRLEGITDQMLDDSLRVSGTGPAKAQVFGATVERVPHVDTTATAVRAAQEKVTALEEQDRALEDQIKQANARKEFLDSLRSTYVKERTENLAVRPMDPKEWTNMVEFVAKQYEAVLEQIRKSESARRQLAKQLQAARQELDQVRAKGGLVTKTVTIDLRAERAGTFELEMSYVVPAASWNPIWDARLDADKQTIALSLYGSARQFSGEDWTDVALAVSTARPSRGIEVPDLLPQYLEPIRPMPPMEAAPRALLKGRADELKAEGMAPALEAFEPAEAAVTQGLLAATFTAPRRESIDSSGTPRRAFLTTFPLKAELTRIAAPKREEQTFLIAKATNESGPVLLAGPVNIFLGDEFTGKTHLPTVPPGDEIKLAFGPDDRVKVERKIIERKHETTGVFSKEDLYRYRIRTTIKNLYATPVTATILDQIPVSRDETIKVTVLDGSTKPTEPEDPMKPGVRSYTFTLQPKTEQVIELAYEVRSPKGQMIGGLE